MASKSKKPVAPEKREPPYLVEPTTGPMADSEKKIIDRKSKKKVGVVKDYSSFTEGGKSSFKPEWDDPYGHLNRLFVPRLDSFEKAAAFLYNVWYAAEEARKAVPVNSEVLTIIREMARTIRRETEIARDLSFNANSKQRELRYVAKKLGIRDLVWELGDDDDIEEILKFCLSGSDVPFFSETVLYDLIGKDDARSVLGLLRRMIKRVDPVKEHDV